MGGVEYHVQRLVGELSARGHDQRVVTSDLLRLEGDRIATADRLTAPGSVAYLRALRIPTTTLYPILPSLPFRLLADRSDIWHAHAFWFWPADLMTVMARARRKRLVVSPYFYARDRAMWRGYRRLLQPFFDRADAVTVISEFEAGLLEEQGFRPGRVEVVTPGIDVEEFDSASPGYLSKLGLVGRPVVLFVGRVGAGKEVEQLLGAAPIIFRGCPEAAIVVAGPDFGDLPRLRARVDEMGLGGSVKFTGRLARPDLLSLYRSATVFTLPTRYEAFGIVCAEAMASRVPVVASRISAVPEVVRDGQDGLLFEPGNVEELASNVTRLLEDPGLRRRLGESGRARVEATFTYPVQVDRLEALYREVA